MFSFFLKAYYFDRADVALPNFASYFKKAAHEELEHAEKFMEFQNKRGGKIVLSDIKKPEKDEWGIGIDAMFSALALERKVNQALLDLHAVSDKGGDFHMSDFIEGNFLHEQVDAIKELTGHITNLKRVGVTGLGEYQFEKESLS